MKSGGKKRDPMNTSLETPQTPNTVRLRWLMDQQQKLEIGARLKGLRDNSSETNRSIGDYVGVSERTVAEWSAGRQGITYDHAKKVAQLFAVDPDWFWRGKGGEVPDVLGLLNGESPQFTRLEEKLDRILEWIESIDAASVVDDVAQESRQVRRTASRRRGATG